MSRPSVSAVLIQAYNSINMPQASGGGENCSRKGLRGTWQISIIRRKEIASVKCLE
jgi:hypothetical protein